MSIYDAINSVIVEGRLAKDPVLSYTPNTQTAVCRMRMLNDKPYVKDKEQEPNGFNVVIWKKLAEDCGRDLKKGSRAIVEGRLETRTFTNNEGQRVEITEIIAEKVKYDKPRSQQGYGNSQPNQQTNPQGYPHNQGGNVPPVPPSSSFTADPDDTAW